MLRYNKTTPHAPLFWTHNDVWGKTSSSQNKSENMEKHAIIFQQSPGQESLQVGGLSSNFVQKKNVFFSAEHVWPDGTVLRWS